MHPKSPQWLDDIATRCRFIREVTSDRSLVDYEADLLLRSGIERTFEVIGEALLRIERNDPATAARITDYRRIIGFRNRLVHGYDVIDNAQVWEIIQRFVPVLHNEVEQLLGEAESP